MICKPNSPLRWLAIAIAITTAVMVGERVHAAAPAATPAATDAAAFSVKVTGVGRPIILIPGLASSGEVWDGTVARYCAKDYQCHVLTLAGFAGQPAIAAPLLPTVEQQLDAYIHANHLDHAIVIGHSLGGTIALQMAINYPQDVSRLIIVDSLPALGATQMPSATPEQLATNAARIKAQMAAADDAGYAAGARSAVATMVTSDADAARIDAWGVVSDRRTTQDAMEAIMAIDLRQDVSRIHVPTLVLGTWIAYKQYAPRSAIENTFITQYQGLPGVKVILTDNARHFIMYDDPNWMYAQFDAFLKA